MLITANQITKYHNDKCIFKDISFSIEENEKELINNGIPVFSDSSNDYLDTIEIQTIINVLKILDNPTDDIALVSVLRSEIGGFNDNEILEIRFFDREKEFAKLREIEEASHEVAQFTIITGRRRIGKTEMVKKFYENTTILYFFVARKAESELCQIFIDEIRTKLNIPVIDGNGEVAPYNGEPEYSINTDKAKELGYRFSDLQDWIYELLDYYIAGCGS